MIWFVGLVVAWYTGTAIAVRKLPNEFFSKHMSCGEEDLNDPSLFAFFWIVSPFVAGYFFFACQKPFWAAIGSSVVKASIWTGKKLRPQSDPV